MKAVIDLLEVQNYCDIANFIYQINVNKFYMKICDKLKYIYEKRKKDGKYTKEYEEAYDICCTNSIVIVSFEMEYAHKMHTIGLFGDYVHDKIIIIDEVESNTSEDYFGVFDTDYIVSLINDLRGKDRCDRTGDLT